MDPKSKRAVICRSDQLADGGPGVRFVIDDGDAGLPAFAVRYEGKVSAFVNRCSHMALPLDLKPGAFFDADKRYIICATHAALYEPGDGSCVSGPCNGAGLVVVAVAEREGRVLLSGDRYHSVSTETIEE